MQYAVPFVSQYADIGDHEWRARGCGIAALKMVMDFWHTQDPRQRTASLDELLEAGRAVGAYRDGIGWVHRGLVDLAMHYGYAAFNIDAAPQSSMSRTPLETWGLVVAELQHGPIMTSVWRYMDPEPSGGHMVVVTDWTGELISYIDPIELTEREGRKVLTLDPFLRMFKQRFIVVRPYGILQK